VRFGHENGTALLVADLAELLRVKTQSAC
jgi:hypothetical protein